MCPLLCELSKRKPEKDAVHFFKEFIIWKDNKVSTEMRITRGSKMLKSGKAMEKKEITYGHYPPEFLVPEISHPWLFHPSHFPAASSEFH